MILLEINNKIVEDTLKEKFENAIAGNKPDVVDVTAADFDGVLYRVTSKQGDRTKILVSIRLNYYKELEQHGAGTFLSAIYGDFLEATPESGYSVSLQYDLEKVKLMDKQAAVELARNASLLKRNCFAAVFMRYFEFQQRGEEGGERAVIHYREDEVMYVEAKKDRVVCVFQTQFKDDDDVVIGKVFLQEFKEGRKRAQEAPAVVFSSREPPNELKDMNIQAGSSNTGFIAFVLFPHHCTPARRDNTINLIHTFRNYLHYHIKCSKAYIHLRMRAKTTDFLKVLNRAKPEPKVVERKTMAGKTFQQAK